MYGNFAFFVKVVKEEEDYLSKGWKLTSSSPTKKRLLVKMV